MFRLSKIVGKRVLTIRGFASKKKEYIEPRYILFDDNKTFIELTEQDYYTYHDCSSAVRYIEVKQDKIRWKDIFNDKVNYPISNIDI